LGSCRTVSYRSLISGISFEKCPGSCSCILGKKKLHGAKLGEEVKCRIAAMYLATSVAHTSFISEQLKHRPGQDLLHASMFYGRGLTCQWSLKWYFVGLHWRICYHFNIYLCGLVEIWSEGCHSSTEVSAPVNLDNHSKVCVLFMMSPELFCSFHAFLLYFSHVQSKTRQICWLPIWKSEMALNFYSNKHQLRNIIECCGCRAPQIDSEDGDIKSPSDRKLYILWLLVLVVNLETFGYTFI